MDKILEICACFQIPSKTDIQKSHMLHLTYIVSAVALTVWESGAFKHVHLDGDVFIETFLESLLHNYTSHT